MSTIPDSLYMIPSVVWVLTTEDEPIFLEKEDGSYERRHYRHWCWTQPDAKELLRNLRRFPQSLRTYKYGRDCAIEQRPLIQHTLDKVSRAPWVLIDVANGHNNTRRYLWQFETRDEARRHKAWQKQQRNGAELIGPYRLSRQTWER